MSSWCPAGCSVVALQHLNELARPILNEVKVFPADGADLEHVAKEVAGGLKGQIKSSISGVLGGQKSSDL